MLHLYRDTLRTEIISTTVNGAEMLFERPILGPIKARFAGIRIPLKLGLWIYKRWYAGA